MAVQVRSEIAAVQIPTASPNPSNVTELPNKCVVYTLIPARYQNTRGRPTYFKSASRIPGKRAVASKEDSLTCLGAHTSGVIMQYAGRSINVHRRIEMCGSDLFFDTKDAEFDVW